MAEPEMPTPRWGSLGRDRKARAILGTLVAHCGARIVEATWLDIGCGSGGIAGALAPHVDRIHGVDPEPWPTWETLVAEHSNLSFLVAGFDGEELPVPDATVDVVVCNQVYEHVARPAALVRNIHRVLKPGGVCHFAGPNLLWPIEPHVYWPFVHWLPRRMAQRLMQTLGSMQVEQLDAFSRTYWGLSSWFSDVGFRWVDGIAARVSVELDLRGCRRSAAPARSIPAVALKPLAPLWPGFIFMLHKQDRGG